jgi:hypothetical protein
MHKLLFVALLMCSTVAMAEEPAAAPDGGGKPRAERGERGDRPKPDFNEMKAKILKKMDEHRACVQAAADFEALKACRPHRQGGEGGGRRGGWGHRKGGEGGAGGGDAPGGEE